MAEHSYFQRIYDETTLISGDGDPAGFENEADFVSYYASRLGKVLRADELKAVALDESEKMIVVGFPDGFDSGGGQLRGIISENGLDMKSALEELDWRAF